VSELNIDIQSCSIIGKYLISGLTLKPEKLLIAATCENKSHPFGNAEGVV